MSSGNSSLQWLIADTAASGDIEVTDSSESAEPSQPVEGSEHEDALARDKKGYASRYNSNLVCSFSVQTPESLDVY